MHIISFNQNGFSKIAYLSNVLAECRCRIGPLHLSLQYLKLERAFISFEVESVFGHRLISHLIFQLAELHVYLVPDYAWEENRGLAEKSVVEGCISLGFVR